MHIPKWTRISEFPASRSEWSSYYPLLFMRIDGEARVRRHVKTANPTFPILLSAPWTHRQYLPPILVDSKKPTRRLKRDSKLMSYTCGAVAVFGGIGFYMSGADLVATLGIFLAFLVMSLYFGFNYRLYQTDVDNLVRRWQFHGWCFSRGPLHAGAFLLFMTTIGAFQWYGAAVFESEEAVKEAFGLIYATLHESREWWRFLTGALLHNGLDHWLANTLIGSGLFLIYGPVHGTRVFAVVFISAPLSLVAVYAAYFVFPLDSQGVVGISGGIGGAVGYFLAANMRYRGSFPDYYFVTTLFVASSTLLLISIVVSVTSFVGHLGGFLVGIALGYLTQPISPSFYLDETDEQSSGSRQGDTVPG